MKKFSKLFFVLMFILFSSASVLIYTIFDENSEIKIKEKKEQRLSNKRLKDLNDSKYYANITDDFNHSLFIKINNISNKILNNYKLANWSERYDEFVDVDLEYFTFKKGTKDEITYYLKIEPFLDKKGFKFYLTSSKVSRYGLLNIETHSDNIFLNNDSIIQKEKIKGFGNGDFKRLLDLYEIYINQKLKNDTQDINNQLFQNGKG